MPFKLALASSGMIKYYADKIGNCTEEELATPLRKIAERFLMGSVGIKHTGYAEAQAYVMVGNSKWQNEQMAGDDYMFQSTLLDIITEELAVLGADEDDPEKGLIAVLEDITIEDYDIIDNISRPTQATDEVKAKIAKALGYSPEMAK